MLELEEALSRILRLMPAARRESIALEDSPGRIAADPLHAPLQIGRAHVYSSH